MNWPSAQRVAQELRLLNDNTQGAFHVLLQVRPADDGDWTVYTGDQRRAIEEERSVGYWGGPLALPGCGGRDMRPQRFDSVGIARELLRQAKQHAAQKGPFEQERPLFWQPGTDDYSPGPEWFPQPPSRAMNGLGASRRGSKAPPGEKRITVAYGIITPESAEEGDYAERGWENEEGVSVDDVEDAVRMLKYDGATEPSSSHFHRGVWYSTSDGDTNYRTGEVTYREYFLEGFSEQEELAVFQMMTGRHGRDVPRGSMSGLGEYGTRPGWGTGRDVVATLRYRNGRREQVNIGPGTPLPRMEVGMRVFRLLIASKGAAVYEEER